jgi:putative transposase
VLDVLHSLRFVDLAPPQVYAILLDEDIYLCSIRTMYRILAEHHEVRERRNQLRHPAYAKPELLATRPNEVWSWGITKLKGPGKWQHYHLYVVMDIFSRCVVGWTVVEIESADVARDLFLQTADDQGITPGQLIVHADRGAAMTSRTVAVLFADLGIKKSHSRPHTSNDNPFSEAHFKTLKYRPDFPERFTSLGEARDFCRRFFAWYNQEHRHSGLGLLTPAVVHYDQAQAVLAARRRTLQVAYQRHPERFVRKVPQPINLPECVWINPPAQLPEAAD